MLALRRRGGRCATASAELIVILPSATCVVAALLRHASEGSASGFLPLVLLPIVWLAVFGSRRAR